MNATWTDLVEIITEPMAWSVISVGICASVACALLGCYLVLRRMSLIGDAISHAVLPGLVLAFLWSGTRNPLPMLAGAIVLGMLTALLTSSLHRIGHVPEDSSMGVVFTSLFAVGVLLITVFASQVDLDPGCVLYGLIEFVVFDTVNVGGYEIPRQLFLLGGLLVLNLAFILVFWKELKLTSFDAALATSLGFSPVLMHYLLMGMVAASTVASFEAVGSILVIAMLIVPGATAHLLTDRMGWMMVWATVVAIVASVLGYVGAVWWNTSVAGMMSVVVGLEFTLAVFVAPRHGVLARVVHSLSIGLRILYEDALSYLWRTHEQHGVGSIEREKLLSMIGGGLMGRLALLTMQRNEWVIADNGRLLLTGEGHAHASRIMRTHRLWEAYMTETLGHSADTVHESAHRVEHFLSDETARKIDEHLSSPLSDPHGHGIPPQAETAHE